MAVRTIRLRIVLDSSSAMRNVGAMSNSMRTMGKTSVKQLTGMGKALRRMEGLWTGMAGVLGIRMMAQEVSKLVSNLFEAEKVLDDFYRKQLDRTKKASSLTGGTGVDRILGSFQAGTPTPSREAISVWLNRMGSRMPVTGGTDAVSLATYPAMTRLPQAEKAAGAMDALRYKMVTGASGKATKDMMSLIMDAFKAKTPAARRRLLEVQRAVTAGEVYQSDEMIATLARGGKNLAAMGVAPEEAIMATGAISHAFPRQARMAGRILDIMAIGQLAPDDTKRGRMQDLIDDELDPDHKLWRDGDGSDDAAPFKKMQRIWEWLNEAGDNPDEQLRRARLLSPGLRRRELSGFLRGKEFPTHMKEARKRVGKLGPDAWHGVGGIHRASEVMSKAPGARQRRIEFQGAAEQITSTLGAEPGSKLEVARDMETTLKELTTSDGYTALSAKWMERWKDKYKGDPGTMYSKKLQLEVLGLANFARTILKALYRVMKVNGQEPTKIAAKQHVKKIMDAWIPILGRHMFWTPSNEQRVANFRTVIRNAQEWLRSLELNLSGRGTPGLQGAAKLGKTRLELLPIGRGLNRDSPLGPTFDPHTLDVLEGDESIGDGIDTYSPVQSPEQRAADKNALPPIPPQGSTMWPRGGIRANTIYMIPPQGISDAPARFEPNSSPEFT